MLLGVAESAAKLKHIDVAIAAYDRYLQLRPTAPDRADVEQKRAGLAQTSAQLTVTTEPAGAEVQIDGQPTGKQTPAVLQISPGAHQLTVALAGYTSDPVQLTAAPGAELTQLVALRPIAPPPPPQPPPTAAEVVKAPPAPPPSPPMAALWVTGGLGAAGIITGTVLGILALKEHSDFDKHPTEAGADRGERLALFSDVGFGIGAMALVTTAVLLFTHDDTPPDQGQGQAKVSVVPTFSAAGASATAKVRF